VKGKEKEGEMGKVHARERGKGRVGELDNGMEAGRAT
jgi:hypothetical protein